jgi:methionine-rich copper-binding protein CopC
MSMLGRVGLAVTVVAVVAVAAAGAAPSLVSPAPGSSMTTTHPVFTWTLPSGEGVESISVARSPKINPSTNDFMPAELAEIGVLESDMTTWKPERPLAAGTYYWHVASKSADVKHMFSPVRSFVIRPAITKVSIAVKTYGLQRTFLITTSWLANERKVSFTARLFAGTKKLAEKKLATDNFLIDVQKQDLSTWVIPSTVKKGTRLRFVVFLKTQGGAKRMVTKILRAP